MSIRGTIGAQLDSTLGRERTDRIRAAERSVRGRLADAISPASNANPIEDYFNANEGRLLWKWQHYFDIYHRHFAAYRGRPITVVEFGVFHGGSLQMWKDYFGPQARIIGVDILPDCAAFAEDGIEIFIGDQEDRSFLADFAAKVGPIDVLIDDGGHSMGQQLATFQTLWPSVTDGGVFLIEDLHTSYWERFGGGHLNPGSFIEFSKTLIDQINAWHSEDPSLVVDDYTRTIRSMHVYDSIIAFEKGSVTQPFDRQTGYPSFPEGHPANSDVRPRE